MKYDEIKTAWNAQADEHNRWDELGEDEKIEWAAIHAAAKARGPAPIFYSEARRKLGDLQAKGFNVVGYALEHCNSWQDNRRCTVDYNGLVSWVPSADEEVAKERIARAGVEHRRALHEALQQEREACAKVCDEFGDKMGGSVGAYDCAAAIRARNT